MTGNDLETSEVPLSVLFCIIEKNAFLMVKDTNLFLNLTANLTKRNSLNQKT